MTKAAFPQGVTAHVLYGPRIRAAAVYLNVQQLIPEDRVSEIMKDMLGAGLLCPASIATWSTKKAAELAPFETQIAALVAAAPVRHLDETGFRIGGKGQWWHTAGTPGLTWYRVTSKRGEILRELAGGIVVHDHFKHVPHAQGCQPWLVQRPSPARTQGVDRNREGTLGQANVPTAASRQQIG